MSNTIEIVRELIHERYDLDPAALDADTPFSAFGLDSLALAEFLFTVEDRFKIEFPNGGMDLDTLTQLAAMIDAISEATYRQMPVRTIPIVA